MPPLAVGECRSPGWTGVSEMFGDDRLLVTQVHEGLHDGVGVRHVQADLWQLVVHTLETLKPIRPQKTSVTTTGFVNRS